jgi:lipopolysaccharide/colanic/teichoic acid biosynthesis glycosyltransferase
MPEHMPNAELTSLAAAPVDANDSDRLKRVLDLTVSVLGLLILSPLLLLCGLCIWLEDRGHPLYMAPRVGRNGRFFRMVKFRSMVINADRTGVDSTAGNDRRITRMGHVIRRLKLDEVSQLWNVLRGDMSLVGPRPNVERDVRLYTAVERGLLVVRPGITDFASIVFADEGEILTGADDPDLRYNQVIRPWKSRMGLHYIQVRTPDLDVRLIVATLLNGFSRRRALAWVAALLRETGADAALVEVAQRRRRLEAAPPPGASDIVRTRETI